IDEGAIRTGLTAIATLNQEMGLTILEERRQRGPYQNLADFRRRVQPGPETLAALIRCGALDFTGRPRPALFLEAELLEREQGSGGRGQGTDYQSLFPDPCPL